MQARINKLSNIHLIGWVTDLGTIDLVVGTACKSGMRKAELTQAI